MRRDPLHGCIASLRSSREGVFWGEGIIHGDHQTLYPIRQLAAEGILSVEIPHDEAAAMKINQDRKWAIALGRIDSDGDIAIRTRNQAIFDVGNRFPFRLTHLSRQGVDGFAGLYWSQSARLRIVDGPQVVKKCLGLRIDGHKRCSFTERSYLH